MKRGVGPPPFFTSPPPPSKALRILQPLVRKAAPTLPTLVIKKPIIEPSIGYSNQKEKRQLN